MENTTLKFPEQRVSSVPDSMTILKESLDILRKRIVFLVFLCLPMLYGIRSIFEDLLVLFATEKTIESGGNALISIYFILVAHYIRNVLLLNLKGSISFARSLILGIKKLPIILYFSFIDLLIKLFYPNNSDYALSRFFDITYLLEDEDMPNAQKLLFGYTSYFGKDVFERLNFMNPIIWFSLLNLAPWVYFYIVSNNILFLIIFYTFVVIFMSAFILQPIYKYHLYKHIKQSFITDGVTKFIEKENQQAVESGKSALIVSDVFEEKFDALFFRIFNGRLSRKGFWIGISLSTIVFIICILLLMLSPILLSKHNKIYDFFIGLVYIIFVILLCVSCTHILAYTIRRLHDIGKSGWACLQIFIPFYGLLILAQFFLWREQWAIINMVRILKVKE